MDDPQSRNDSHDNLMMIKKVYDDGITGCNVTNTNVKQPSKLQKPLYEEGEFGKNRVNTFADHWLLESKDVMVPLLLQTTCAVYAGTSGGPIVTLHPQHGKAD